ncbi:hypothetical protein J4434_01445 [Candidatus Woesearchaeota archaeon]|nr:hypothetical protein [Candidatus Woesearchaeota archaeon]
MVQSTADNYRRQTSGDSTLGNFMNGVGKIGLMTFLSYVTRAGRCVPIPYDVNVTNPISPSIAIGAGFVAGISDTNNLEAKVAGVLGGLASLAPDVYDAATTGDLKRAGTMAGTKVALYLGSYLVGYVANRLFK